MLKILSKVALAGILSNFALSLNAETRGSHMASTSIVSRDCRQKFPALNQALLDADHIHEPVIAEAHLTFIIESAAQSHNESKAFETALRKCLNDSFDKVQKMNDFAQAKTPSDLIKIKDTVSTRVRQYFEVLNSSPAKRVEHLGLSATYTGNARTTVAETIMRTSDATK